MRLWSVCHGYKNKKANPCRGWPFEYKSKVVL